jgi:hypothetical protein
MSVVSLAALVDTVVAASVVMVYIGFAGAGTVVDVSIPGFVNSQVVGLEVGRHSLLELVLV